MGTPISGLVEMTALESNDAFPVAESFGVRGGTKRISAANLLKAGGKVLIVDGTNGVDAKAARGTHLAFKTITAAKAAAFSGDLIIVYPGTYQETDLLNWPSAGGVQRRLHFMAGATVINDVSSPAIRNGTDATKAIFDDSNSEMDVLVTGNGDFVTTFGTADFNNDEALAVPCNVNRRAFVNIQHEDSDITIHFNRATYSGYADAGVQLAYIVDCHRAELRGVYLGTTNATSSTDIGEGESNGPITIEDCFGGVWWGEGETYLDIAEYKNGLYCIYPEGTGVTDPTNLWVRAQRIEGTVFTPFYCNGTANANYKVWLTADELIATGTGNNAINIQCNGKLYLDVKKISSLSGTGPNFFAHSAAGLQVWLNCQKLTAVANGTDLLTIGSSLNNHPVSAWIDVMHYEDLSTQTGSLSSMIKIQGTATRAYIGSGVVNTSTNRRGITHVAGLSFIRGLRVESNGTNDADNKPVVAEGSGLVLDGCTLLAPALADSIFAGSAQNVKVYGTTFANKAANGNVTIQVGTLTVSTDVT